MVIISDIRYEIGDCKTLIKKISDCSVQLIVTSPPYWNAKNYGSVNQIGFNQSYSDYLSNLNEVWKECERVLSPNGKICVNIQPLPVSKEDTNLDRSSIQNIMCDVEMFMRGIGLSLSNIIIWDKRKYNNQKIFGSYPYPPNMYSHISFEYIYVFRKEGETQKKSKEIKEKSKITVDEWKEWCFNSIWDIPPVIKFGGKGKNQILSHIAPFPLEIPRRLIKLFSFAEDTVLDPFLGCGTTLGACILESRNGIGFELQSEYETLIKLLITNPKKVPTYELAKVLKNNTTLLDFGEK